MFGRGPRTIANVILIAMLAASAQAQSTEEYEYDALGRLVDAKSDDEEYEIVYEYDNAGNRTKITSSLGVGFSVDDVSVSEGGNLVFTVTKTGVATGSNAVSYATANNTATAGSDYTAKSGSLTFTSAQASKTVSVATTEDGSVESDETLYLNLSNPTNGATILDGQGVGTVENDDYVNYAPEATQDVVFMGGASGASIPVTNNDSDPNESQGDTFSVTSVTTPTAGTATIESGNQSILFTKPSWSDCGGATFDYTITDSHGATDTATVSANWGGLCW